MGAPEYYLRTSLWPAFLFTVTLMVIGFLGNGLILYIYRHHFHRSVPWLFIYVLSILDILACVIAMPSELVILATYNSFPSEAFCKISRYLSFTLHGSSCVILMGIALNRYEKVCRPNRQVLNIKRARWFCMGTILFACVSFSPCFYIYGEKKLVLLHTGDDYGYLPSDYNRTFSNTNSSSPATITQGVLCSIPDDVDFRVALTFYSLQFVLYIVLVVLVIFFYSRVIYQIVSYKNKQQQLLYQLSCQTASRADCIRLADINVCPTKDEQTADFSRDFCRNEISCDVNRLDKIQEKSKEERQHKNEHIISLSPTPSAEGEQGEMKKNISSPILNVKMTKDHSKKLAESENNIHLIYPVGSSDPLETNQLLMRRIQSTDDFNKKGTNLSKLQIVPAVDPYEAMFEPLFLLAPRTHKKSKSEKGSIRKSKKNKDKAGVSRSKSNVDVSMRTVKLSNRDANGNAVSCKSMECLATMKCQPPASGPVNGTVTLTRRTPKGSMNCVLPVFGLSMKSAVSYNGIDRSEVEKEAERNNDNVDDGNNKSNKDGTFDDKGEALDGCKDTTTKRDTEQLHQTQAPQTGNSIAFKITEPPRMQNVKKVQMRRPHENSSVTENRNSADILTPTPKKVEYRRRQSVRPIRANRTSRMLFWISLAFVFSFLPFWIIVIVRTMKGNDFLVGITNAQLGVLGVLIRFTLISNAINPLIYGLMNTQFRNRCSSLFNISARRGG